MRDSQQVLVRLIKTDLPVKAYYGLFHMAILVPDRSALGAALKHILLSGTNLTGGADHGYSEAIYLDDLEGNQSRNLFFSSLVNCVTFIPFSLA